MTSTHPIVFLVDVDNTLVDNDGIQQDLKNHIEQVYGPAARDRYWRILEDLFSSLGYRDYIGALQRYREEHPLDVELLSMSSFLMDYPFAERLYPHAYDVLQRLRGLAPTVILSDGDVVFQPRKVERAGLGKCSDGDVLIYIHKEESLADLTRAADLFKSVYDRTDGVDGFVSLEVSPLLAHDTDGTLEAAADLYKRAGKPNLFIKIPGTPEGLPAIEEAIFAGVPVNVTLLFSREQYVAAAEAYLRGVERRIEKGLNPAVASVASVFISRWDVAVASKVPADLVNKLGIAIGQRTYKAYCDLLASPRFRRVANAGGRAQRLLWASTGTKDPKAPDTLYVKAFASPFTVNTMPEGTLKAFHDHGDLGDALAADGGDCETVLAKFAKAGVDVEALAQKLQDEGAASFVKSWHDLMDRITAKGTEIRKAS